MTNNYLNNEVRNFALELAEKASEEATVFPIDRAFLEGYLDKIKTFNPLEFIYHNLEFGSDLYSNQLFVCLPELWQNISLDDLIEMSNRFTNVLSYFSIIRFTYKYVEIDIIEPILKSKQVQESKHFYDKIIEYLKLQWNVLLKSESDLEDFEDGFIAIDYNEWMYIKQKFLTDKRVIPALLDYNEMKVYIEKFG